jgi:hypothetical protein
LDISNDNAPFTQRIAFAAYILNQDAHLSMLLLSIAVGRKSPEHGFQPVDRTGCTFLTRVAPMRSTLALDGTAIVTNAVSEDVSSVSQRTSRWTSASADGYQFRPVAEASRPRVCRACFTFGGDAATTYRPQDVRRKTGEGSRLRKLMAKTSKEAGFAAGFGV